MELKQETQSTAFYESRRRFMGGSMKSTELLQEIQKVVGHELERVNTDRVPLHSQHEAYAVIKEKYEGASENVHHIEGFVEEFWECVKDKNTACYADVLMAVRDCARNSVFA